jgi:hypothetical protein
MPHRVGRTTALDGAVSCHRGPHAAALRSPEGPPVFPGVNRLSCEGIGRLRPDSAFRWWGAL